MLARRLRSPCLQRNYVGIRPAPLWSADTIFLRSHAAGAGISTDRGGFWKIIALVGGERL
jgi:hypothetical protein